MCTFEIYSCYGFVFVQLGREVLDIAGAAIRIGVTTEEIDRLVHEACIERDCYPSPLNYYNFPKSCCTYVSRMKSVSLKCSYYFVLKICQLI